MNNNVNKTLIYKNPEKQKTKETVLCYTNKRNETEITLIFSYRVAKNYANLERC